MDIAALSMDLSMTKVAQSVQYSMMKKTMESEELAAQEMLKMLPPSPYSFDVRA